MSGSRPPPPLAISLASCALDGGTADRHFRLDGISAAFQTQCKPEAIKVMIDIGRCEPA